MYERKGVPLHRGAFCRGRDLAGKGAQLERGASEAAATSASSSAASPGRMSKDCDTWFPEPFILWLLPIPGLWIVYVNLVHPAEEDLLQGFWCLILCVNFVGPGLPRFGLTLFVDASVRVLQDEMLSQTGGWVKQTSLPNVGVGALSQCMEGLNRLKGRIRKNSCCLTASELRRPSSPAFRLRLGL